MAGGKRIDDHKFFAGGHSKGSVFPEGVHTKEEHSDGHEGHLSEYEDTTEKIREQQESGVRQVKKHSQKPLHRN